MDEYKWVEIVDVNTDKYDAPSWYKLGERYEVKPYRHNPEMFYEIKGWNGRINGVNGVNSGDNTNHCFYIYRKHAAPVIVSPLDDKLFEIE